ncbi:MAG: GNAT family N-acetyltransferase [Bacteroidetes bacterium]|nr:GNAT family N-acetyltransferase [Bacteroidota bacterium]
MNNIKIKRYRDGQEIMIQQLIKKVYDEFVSMDYSKEGNRFFYDWIKPHKIAERQKNQRTILTAMMDSKIVGMIEIRDNNTISLLFIDKAYQGQGIAKKLFQESLKNCIQKDSNLDKFYVHASPFSIPVYKKLGFIETDNMQEENGIKYLPMEMKINK